MSQTFTIHHDLGDITLKANNKVNPARLETVIRSALDQYVTEDRIPAKQLHDDTRLRHGTAYRTPGYFLRLYRQRAGLTQAALAEKSGIRQHHLSEIENNKRALGKVNATRLATILDCDYRKLL